MSGRAAPQPVAGQQAQQLYAEFQRAEQQAAQSGAAYRSARAQNPDGPVSMGDRALADHVRANNAWRAYADVFNRTTTNPHRRLDPNAYENKGFPWKQQAVRPTPPADTRAGGVQLRPAVPFHTGDGRPAVPLR